LAARVRLGGTLFHLATTANPRQPRCRSVLTVSSRRNIAGTNSSSGRDLDVPRRRTRHRDRQAPALPRRDHPLERCVAELLPDHSVEQIMPMSAVSPRRWTRAEVDRLIDERPGYASRYELVGGELLVTTAPSGRHQRIVPRLAQLLMPYLVEHSSPKSSSVPPNSRW